MEPIAKTFCRFPLWEDDSQKKTDVAFVGIPWEGEKSFRKGAKMAPEYMREYSLRYYFNKTEPFDIASGEKIPGSFFIADAGDIFLPKGFPEKSFENITKKTRSLIEKGILPVFIGGDHSVSYPILMAYAGKYKKIVVVNFDAHLDFNNDTKHFPTRNESVMRRVIELENISGIINLGTRGVVSEKHFLEAKKFKNISIFNPDSASLTAIVKKIKKFKPEGIYISFDIDALDPTIAPATPYLETGGLSYKTVKKIINGLAENFKIIGFDLVEINPLLDNSNLTANVSLRLLLDLFFAVNRNLRKKP